MNALKYKTMCAHLPIEIADRVVDKAKSDDRSVSYVLGKIITDHYRNLPEVRFCKAPRARRGKGKEPTASTPQ